MKKGNVYRYQANTEPDCGLHEYDSKMATIDYVRGNHISAFVDGIQGAIQVYKDELFDLNDPNGFGQS
jgi:hypothetical protein